MDVIHNIYVDVVQHHTVAITRRSSHVIHDISEDNSILGRRDLDTSFNISEVVWGESEWTWLLNQLQIT